MNIHEIGHKLADAFDDVLDKKGIQAKRAEPVKHGEPAARYANADQRFVDIYVKDLKTDEDIKAIASALASKLPPLTDWEFLPLCVPENSKTIHGELIEHNGFYIRAIEYSFLDKTLCRFDVLYGQRVDALQEAAE